MLRSNSELWWHRSHHFCLSPGSGFGHGKWRSVPLEGWSWFFPFDKQDFLYHDSCALVATAHTKEGAWWSWTLAGQCWLAFSRLREALEANLGSCEFFVALIMVNRFVKLPRLNRFVKLPWVVSRYHLSLHPWRRIHHQLAWFHLLGRNGHSQLQQTTLHGALLSGAASVCWPPQHISCPEESVTSNGLIIQWSCKLFHQFIRMPISCSHGTKRIATIRLICFLGS